MDYVDTFIAVAENCKADRGKAPVPRGPSKTGLTSSYQGFSVAMARSPGFGRGRACSASPCGGLLTVVNRTSGFVGAEMVALAPAKASRGSGISSRGARWTSQGVRREAASGEEPYCGGRTQWCERIFSEGS